MKMEAIPKIIKTITATNKTPPITVKSHLVWNAKSVRAKQTAAVIPTAKNTCNYSEQLNFIFIFRFSLFSPHLDCKWPLPFPTQILEPV